MKKINLVAISSILIAVTAIFSACKTNEVDVEKPVITLNSPEQHAVLLIGDEAGIHLDMDLADNEALASYKISIHANFDGHTHAVAPMRAKSLTTNDSVPFEMTKIWTDIAGQKSAKIHHHEIKIPKEINGKPIKSGDYHFMVHCLDKAGNESYIAVDVELSYDATGIGEHVH